MWIDDAAYSFYRIVSAKARAWNCIDVCAQYRRRFLEIRTYLALCARSFLCDRVRTTSCDTRCLCVRRLVLNGRQLQLVPTWRVQLELPLPLQFIQILQWAGKVCTGWQVNVFLVFGKDVLSAALRLRFSRLGFIISSKETIECCIWVVYTDVGNSIQIAVMWCKL